MIERPLFLPIRDRFGHPNGRRTDSEAATIALPCAGLEEPELRENILK
jgi:hypothetical protein